VVPGEELVQDVLQRLVDRHGGVLAQVVSAGRAGGHVGSEGPLEAFLGKTAAG